MKYVVYCPITNKYLPIYSDNDSENCIKTAFIFEADIIPKSKEGPLGTRIGLEDIFQASTGKRQ